MPIQMNGQNIGAVFYGSTPIREVYLGSEPVWSNLPLVTLTGTTTTAARDQLRSAVASYGGNYQTMTKLPFRLDTSSVTNMNSVFSGCAALTRVPELDTSAVTDMGSMFLGCAALTRVPELDTSAVTNMNSMFSGCAALTRVPELDMRKLSAAGQSGMFRNCSSLTTVPPLNMPNATVSENMFLNCTSLVTAPEITAPKLSGMIGMYQGCTALTHVPEMNTASGTYMNQMFQGCISLTDGNVRCIGKNSGVSTTDMIKNSALTRLPFYDTNGNWTG